MVIKNLHRFARVLSTLLELKQVKTDIAAHSLVEADLEISYIYFIDWGDCKLSSLYIVHVFCA